jgi:hypothetical protein
MARSAKPLTNAFEQGEKQILLVAVYPVTYCGKDEAINIDG